MDCILLIAVCSLAILRLYNLTGARFLCLFAVIDKKPIYGV